MPARPERRNARRDESRSTPVSPGLSLKWSHRSTNLIAWVGHTPPQLWQRVQSVVRVVKSGLMASNGQISTHLLQWMQDASTFRSLTRSRLPRENTAPLGQTYLHQNRGFHSPINRTAKKRTIDTTCPALTGGTLCQPR